MVARTCLSVTLYVHCLSCLRLVLFCDALHDPQRNFGGSWHCIVPLSQTNCMQCSVSYLNPAKKQTGERRKNFSHKRIDMGGVAERWTTILLEDSLGFARLSL
jgi:hypothetical protein